MTQLTRRLIVGSLAVSLFATGCASTRVQLEATPDDARIYVDGEYLGKGTTSIDVGPEYNYPKSYSVLLKRDGYETIEKTISNQPDYTVAGMNFGLLVGLSMLNAMLWASNPQQNAMNGIVAGGTILISPIAFFNSNKFKKRYSIEMEKKEAK